MVPIDYYPTLEEAKQKSNKYDIGRFLAVDGNCFELGKVASIGEVVGFRQPIHGEIVQVHLGWSSTTVRCKISFVAGTCHFQNKQTKYYANIDQIITLEGIGHPGDSGSLVIAEKDRKVVGIVSYGPKYDEPKEALIDIFYATCIPPSYYE